MARKRPDRKPPEAGPRANGTAPLNYTGLKYGENQAVNEMLPARNQGASVPTGQPAQGGQPRPPSLVEPTSRPQEPMTAGIDYGAGPGSNGPILEQDPNLYLKALYAQFPHPDIARMLQRLAQ